MFLLVQTFRQYMGINHFFTLIVLVKCFEYHETIAETETEFNKNFTAVSLLSILTGKYLKLRCQI